MEHIRNGSVRAEDMAARFGLDLFAVRKYLEALDKHIQGVQGFGRLLKVPASQLYVHDESKWSDAEFPAYVRKHGAGIDNPDEFAAAFLHHLHANPHHWQAWILPHADKNVPVEMPPVYVREMVADWLGANAAYSPDGNPQEWLNGNAGKMLLHPATEQTLRSVLLEVGLRWPK